MKMNMKKILLALSGIALLLASCTKGEDYYIEQAPYRKVVDYQASTFTMTVPGTLTPSETYSWISVNTSGNTATFTTRLNTSGKVRRAEFAISNGETAVVSQKAHGLKAEVILSLTGRSEGVASMNVSFTPDDEKNLSDYANYGIRVSSSQDKDSGTDHSTGTQPVIGDNSIELSGVSDDKAYYVWGFVESSEGDRVYSDLLGLLQPLKLASGEDLQAAINSAAEFQEVRCAAGGVYAGSIFLRDNVPVSGGWNSSFTSQDYNNKSVIDCGGVANCVFSGVSSSGDIFGAKNSSIDNFEIRNGLSTIASGGCGAGIFSKGKLTVSNCYIHDCSAPTGKGGGIYCHEGDNDILVVNCRIERTTNADGHGGAFWAQGNNIDVKLIGNIWDYNECKTTHGYSVLMFQGQTQLTLVNNTIVYNCNWRDTGNLDPDMNSSWATIRIRNSETYVFAANNIIAGNYYYKYQDYEYTQYNQGLKDPAYRQWQWEIGDNVANIVESASKNMVSGVDINWKEMGFDLTTIMKDPANGDYTPVGDALNGSYSSDVQAKVANIFKAYPNDINGNPRVVNGNIAVGALAAE